MTVPMYKIRNYVSGDAFTLIRTVDTIPSDSSLEIAWLTIKENYDDADDDAALQKEITSAPSLAGHISDTGAGDTVGTVEFDLTSDETAALGHEKTYHYDVQAKTESGKIATLEIGTIRFRQGLTDAEEAAS